MKLNFHDFERHKTAHWTIVNAVTMAGNVKEVDTENIDITLTVDGIEINLLELTNHLVEMLTIDVEDEARKLVKERMGEIYNQLGDLEMSIENMIDPD